MTSLLLKLGFDGKFVTLTTYSRDNGHHGRFLIFPDTMKTAMESDRMVYDKDISSFIEMKALHSGGRNHLGVRVTWLTDFNNGNVRGVQQFMKIPTELIQHVLNTGETVKYLYQESARQAKIDSSRAGETIRRIICDKHKRRALCKALRDSFQWVDETVNLFNDFGDSFYFTTESGFPSNGGLILFENTYDGHKGLCYQVCT